MNKDKIPSIEFSLKSKKDIIEQENLESELIYFKSEIRLYIVEENLKDATDMINKMANYINHINGVEIISNNEEQLTFIELIDQDPDFNWFIMQSLSDFISELEEESLDVSNLKIATEKLIEDINKNKIPFENTKENLNKMREESKKEIETQDKKNNP